MANETPPGAISDEQAARIRAAFETKFGGAMEWSDERICGTYHVPADMIGVGPPPPYASHLNKVVTGEEM